MGKRFSCSYVLFITPAISNMNLRQTRKKTKMKSITTEDAVNVCELNYRSFETG